MRPLLRSAVALIACLFALSAAASPRLVVERDLVDLGDVVKGESADVTFEIRNAGSAPLRILDVETTCGCTLASHDEVIAAGQSGKVHITLTTDNLWGSVTRGVTVRSDDPDREEQHLTLRANVVGSVHRLPGGTLRVSNSRGPMQQQQLLLRKDPGERGPMRLEGLSSSASWLRAEARPVSPGDPGLAEAMPPVQSGDWLLEVSYLGGAPAGKTMEQVKMRTGLRLEPEISIPVIVVVLPPVNLTSEELTIDAAPGSPPAVLHGSVRRGLKIDDLRVDVEPAGAVEVRFEKTGGRKFRLDVSAAPDRSFSGEARLVLSVGSETHRVLLRSVSSRAEAR